MTVNLPLPFTGRVGDEFDRPLDEQGTGVEAVVIRVHFRHIVREQDHQRRLLPRGHVLVVDAAGRNEPAAGEVFDLGLVK